MLFLQRDIPIFKGALDDFKGIYAESDFIHEDIFSHFTFTDFTLDLNKNFFKIDNAFMQSKGVVDIEATGLYKNKLNSSKNYPFFSVQYHPESSPGPHDSRYLFKKFKDMVLDNSSYAKKKRY